MTAMSREPTTTAEPPDIPAAALRKYFTGILSLKRRAGWAGPGSRAVTAAACNLAAVFVAEVTRKCPGLGLPRIGPSVTGGVGLQWDIGGAGVLVRIASEDPHHVYCLVNGPGFHVGDEVAHMSDVIGKIATIWSRGTTDE